MTGSKEAPIVCLADNNGFPYVRDIYARSSEHDGHAGVHVSARFENEARGNELAINLSQPNMHGECPVIPLC